MVLLNLADSVADFAWVTKKEIGDYFPASTARRLKALLLE